MYMAWERMVSFTMWLVIVVGRVLVDVLREVQSTPQLGLVRGIHSKLLFVFVGSHNDGKRRHWIYPVTSLNWVEVPVPSQPSL